MAREEIESEGFSFDISRMNEAFENGKGYYEMVAKHCENDEQYIFRFNIAAFRNNYGIPDLTKMNLVYYGVHVGNIDITLLDVKKEFNMGDEKTPITSVDQLENEPEKTEKLNVYDIMLAGIE